MLGQTQDVPEHGEVGQHIVVVLLHDDRPGRNALLPARNHVEHLAGVAAQQEAQRRARRNAHADQRQRNRHAPHGTSENAHVHGARHGKGLQTGLACQRTTNRSLSRRSSHGQGGYDCSFAGPRLGLGAAQRCAGYAARSGPRRQRRAARARQSAPRPEYCRPTAPPACRPCERPAAHGPMHSSAEAHRSHYETGQTATPWSTPKRAS